MTTEHFATGHRQQPATAAEARGQVSELLVSALGAVGTGSEADVAVADALLVTSELVTNALRHGGGVAAFATRLTGDAVHICVTDRSPELPQAPAAPGLRPGGFGWALVRRLSRDVTVTPVDGGKTICAEIALL